MSKGTGESILCKNCSKAMSCGYYEEGFRVVDKYIFCTNKSCGDFKQHYCPSNYKAECKFKEMHSSIDVMASAIYSDKDRATLREALRLAQYEQQEQEDGTLPSRGAIVQALEDAQTLRDLKQELKENGDMPNEIYAGRDALHYKAWDTGKGGIDTSYRQYTRTVPTLKKILEGL